MVYVLNIEGHPIMPTENHAKVRILLKQGKAKVIKRCPFTIQLLYETSNYVQEVSLGVDAGSKHIGLSATTKDKVLYEAGVELRNDIVGKLAVRRDLRRNRRSRKTRYRKPRFSNRVKPKGWLAPSVRQKIDCHLTMIKKVHEILPISKIIVEVASFDIQKIKNPEIRGKEYQEGEQLDFWNVREYVLYRDNHTCQCCKGRSKDKILNVHHIESRKTGGNAPNNLITLCKTCHDSYHHGETELPKSIKRGILFRDAAFMGIMRWSFYDKLKTLYPNVSMTYGYITKSVRIENNLPKEHYIDARCISGNSTAKSCGEVFYYKKVRCHNRQIHKTKFSNGGVRKINQLPYKMFNFRLNDKVKFKGNVYFISARRSGGSFKLLDLKRKTIKDSVRYSRILFLEEKNNYICDRMAI